MSPPPSIKLGSVANQTWHDYDAWVQSIAETRPEEVCLAFSESLPVRTLGSCTRRVWDLGYQEILLRIDGKSVPGQHYTIHRSESGTEVEVVVLRAGRESAEVLTTNVETYGGDAFAVGEEDSADAWPVLAREDLRARAESASADSPLHLFIDEEMAFSALREAFDALGDFGARDFICLTYMP